MSTKELEKVFKSLALQINDEQLKEWADEMDEEGMTLIKVFITLTCEISYKHLYYDLRRLCTLVHDYW